MAKASGLYSEKIMYGPRLVIFGRGFMIPGLEEGIVQMQPGQEARIHVPFQRAFGPKQPELVRMMGDKELLRAGVQPRIGLILNIDGVQARVKSVSPGRVMLDFNHPLAGEDLTYHLQLIEIITDPAAKAKALGDEFHTSLAIDAGAKPKPVARIPKLLEAGRARSLAAMLQASVGDSFEVKIDS
ncbi:Putative FKBP-type peptidyl-prolyl cis-trans isomerase [uncultured archaeon]|nr:Putative FKBP-type peptidyl-prolyl cis-trans isomerase [uncultured archaeon]